ncbi:hypothetical protein [Coleofasciculus chthonoplastes]|uniref:hypothetical protein n=1 Tax=Coleofasciculus chthonoplastes TaxID=64178 RepID=UPI0012F77674|nr:hypothetical protein [Coleofasciculus chthonoplastes]
MQRLYRLTLLSCHAFKLGISSEQDAQCSEQDAKPAAWLRLTHYGKNFVIIDIKV